MFNVSREDITHIIVVVVAVVFVIFKKLQNVAVINNSIFVSYQINSTVYKMNVIQKSSTRSQSIDL